MSAAERTRREAQARQEEQARQRELARQEEQARHEREQARQKEQARQEREQARQKEQARQEAEARERELAQQREIARQEHARNLRFEHPEIINNLILNMVFVKGGKFKMGSDAKKADHYERPVHEVSLRDFSIGRYEVTQEEWEAVMGYNPSSFKLPKRPVENVSWEECQVFIAKLNELTGKNFRLPTEAEWEYAARGGCSGSSTRFAGSNKIVEVAWYYVNSSQCTHEVGIMFPNKLGLYDMSGNVSEWCADSFGNYDSVPQVDPIGPSIESRRVIRGGSWRSYSKNCRVSSRACFNPNEFDSCIGLRLAR